MIFYFTHFDASHGRLFRFKVLQLAQFGREADKSQHAREGREEMLMTPTFKAHPPFATPQTLNVPSQYPSTAFNSIQHGRDVAA